MPSALITTIGAANANSYVTLVEAETYFDNRPDATSWPDTDEDEQLRVLLRAAKRLNQLNWLGARAASTQALAWPRIGVAKRDTADIYAVGGYSGWSYPYGVIGEQYLSTEIPQQVKDAQCEFAFEILNGFNDGAEAEVKSFSDDKMSVTFDQPRLAGELPAEVTRLLAGLTGQNRRVRG